MTTVAVRNDSRSTERGVCQSGATAGRVRHFKREFMSMTNYVLVPTQALSTPAYDVQHFVAVSPAGGPMIHCSNCPAEFDGSAADAEHLVASAPAEEMPSDRKRLDWLQEIFESGRGGTWMDLWVEYKDHASLRGAIDHAIAEW